MTVAYVALGANLGDTEHTLDTAVARLGALPGTSVTAVSALRRTEPVGYADQPPFLNGVVELETSLAPGPLLAALLEIERDLGRRREGPRYGPRVVDLDLLLHGDSAVETDALHLPHPRLRERAFVLEPLADLAPALDIPGGGRVDRLLAALGEPPAPVVRAAVPRAPRRI